MLSNETRHWNVGRLSSQHNVGNKKKVHRRERRFCSQCSKCAWSTKQIVRFVCVCVCVCVCVQWAQAFGKCHGLVHTWWRRCHMKQACAKISTGLKMPVFRGGVWGGGLLQRVVKVCSDILVERTDPIFRMPESGSGTHFFATYIPVVIENNKYCSCYFCRYTSEVGCHPANQIKFLSSFMLWYSNYLYLIPPSYSRMPLTTKNWSELYNTFA